MGVNEELNAPAALPPGKGVPHIHWSGGWAGPRTCLEIFQRTGPEYQILLRDGLNLLIRAVIAESV